MVRLEKHKNRETLSFDNSHTVVILIKEILQEKEWRYNMEKNSPIYKDYVEILKRELVPAMGCTEPIAIAYCAAKARAVLGGLPDQVTVAASGNIIKNVKSVIVPNTGGRKGIEAAAAIGIVAGDEEAVRVGALPVDPEGVQGLEPPDQPVGDPQLPPQGREQLRPPLHDTSEFQTITSPVPAASLRRPSSAPVCALGHLPPRGKAL